MTDSRIGFEAHEIVAIGINNVGTNATVTGTPEEIERIIAFSLQSGVEVHGISDWEREKYLAMDVDI